MLNSNIKSSISDHQSLIFSTVGEPRIKKIEQCLSPHGKNILAIAAFTLEIYVCFCSSMPYCSWMDLLHLLSAFHQWDSLHCNQDHGSYKLCHRFSFSLVTIFQSNSQLIINPKFLCDCQFCFFLISSPFFL